MPVPLLTARIVWGALLGAIGLYFVLLGSLVGQPGGAPAVDVESMRPIFMGLAVLAFGGILFFRRVLPTVERDPARGTPADPRNFTAYVVGWALAESIALYGLTLGMLARRVDEALPFFAVGAALLLWQRPRTEHFGP
jgi:hypothetical protein